MQMIRRFLRKLGGLNKLSKLSMKIGAALMVATYIFAIAARLAAAHVPDYYGAIAIYRGCLEAAPAFLVVGICAAFLGDLMLSYPENGQGPPDEDGQDGQ